MSNDKTPAQAAAEEYPPMPFTNVPVHDLNGGKRAAFIRGAEWQASQQRLPSVEKIMEVVLSWDDVDERSQLERDELRRYLTALLDQTPSPR